MYGQNFAASLLGLEEAQAPDTTVEDISIEEAIAVGGEIAELEHSIEGLFSTYDSLVAGAATSEKIIAAVEDIELTDEVKTVLAASIETIAQANGLETGYLSIEEGNMDKVKAFVKTVSNAVLKFLSDLNGFVKKWVAKIMIQLSASDKTRAEYATLVKEKGESAEIMVDEAFIGKNAKGKQVSALTTFNKSLADVINAAILGTTAGDKFAELLGKKFKELKVEKADEIEEAIADDLSVVSAAVGARGKGVVTITTYEDEIGGIIKGFKTINVQVSLDHIKPGKTTLKDAGVSINALNTALGQTKKEMQKSLDEEYKAIKEVEKSFKEKISKIEDKAQANALKAYSIGKSKQSYSKMFGEVAIAKDAIAVAKLVKAGVKDDKKEDEKEEK